MITEKIYDLKKRRNTLHTTWNPGREDVLRIHIIPPKFRPFASPETLVTINGQDTIPISERQAILLNEYVSRLNMLDPDPDDKAMAKVIDDAYKSIRLVYPFTTKDEMCRELDRLIGTFEDVAAGRPIEDTENHLTLGQYSVFMDAPHRVDLMVSSMVKCGAWHCNQKCIHCYAAEQELAGEDELSLDDWKRVIDILRDNKVTQLTFTGGEPTMRDDLPEMISYARWFVTRLNTNGAKLTPELCASLRAAELDSMQVTFYSHDRDVHNRLVGAKNFDKTVDGIRNALQAGINLSINTPICELNSDYEETLRFAHSLGVRYVTCSGLILTGYAKTDRSSELHISSDKLSVVLENAVNFAYKNDIELNFTSPGIISDEKLISLGLDIPSCGACLSNMAVSPSGNVVPCQSWLSDKPLGNILKDSWKEIWNCEECKRIRSVSAAEDHICQLREHA